MDATFNTVDDMIAYVMASASHASEKFSIDSTTHREWVDPVEGKAWEALNDLNPWTPDSDDPEKHAAQLAFEAEEKRLPRYRPADQLVTKWYLSLTGHSWLRYDRNIPVAAELAEQIDAAWTKREAYRGATYKKNVGNLTVLGMLKRIGKDKGVAEKIAAARKAAEEKAEANRRAYAQQRVSELAQQILKIQQDNPKIAWPVQLAELVQPLEK